MIAATSGFTTPLSTFLRGKILIMITIQGYSRIFTNYASGIGGQFNWFRSIEDIPIVIHDLDGGADQIQVAFNIQDFAAGITSDFPSFTFEGKQVTVKVGMSGMAQSDFTTLFTGFIDTVASDNFNTEYTFNCSDISSRLTQVVYLNGDSGLPIDSGNPKTLLAHPLDLLLNILAVQVGMNSIPDFDNVLGTWSTDATMPYSATGGAVSGGKWTYTGTGAAAGFHFVKSQTFSVVPGQVLNVSGYFDGSHVTVGAPNLDIFDPTISTLYAAIGPATGAAAGQISGSWTVPPGVTQVVVLFDTNNCTVATGQPLIFSSPQLSSFGSQNFFDVNKIRAYRDGPFNGAQFEFKLTQSVAALDFIKQQILKPLGGYLWVNSLGVLTVNFFYPLTVPTPVATLGPNSWTTIPTAEQVGSQSTEMINQVQFQFDKDDATPSGTGNYLAVDTEQYAASISQYAQYGEQVIQSDGLRSGFQGFFTARLVARMIFGRYGLKSLIFDQNAAESIWQTCLFEPGDIVAVTHANIPNRTAGVMGITGKLFEILNKNINLTEGLLTYTMIDASYLQTFGLFKIALDTQTDYNLLTSASDLTAAAWVGSAVVTANSAAAPDGTVTADTLNDNSATLFLGKQQVVVVPADTAQYEIHIYVKKTSVATNTFGVNIIATGGSAGAGANESFPRLNTNSGVATGTGVSVIDAGSYWKLICTISNDGTWTGLGPLLQPATGTNSGTNPAVADAASTTGTAIVAEAGMRRVTETNTYMFLCSDLDQYTNGDPAHTLG